MSDGIKLSIGTDSSTIADSKVAVGNVAGGDIRITKQSSHRINSEIKNRIEEVERCLNELMPRIYEIEKALGGQFGVGGVVPEVKQISQNLSILSSDIHELKSQLRTDRYQDKRWSTIFLVVASILFVLSLFMTINGLWN